MFYIRDIKKIVILENNEIIFAIISLFIISGGFLLLRFLILRLILSLL